MLPIQPSLLSALEWRQPSTFGRAYELRSGDSLIATLDFLKVLGTLARARTATESWTFKRAGFLTPVVTVRAEGGEMDLATYHPNWSGNKGQLDLPGGERLEFRATNFWSTEWALSSPQGGELLRFHNKGLLHHGASVDVAEAARARSDIGMLITLCWYILTLHMQDASVAASV